MTTILIILSLSLASAAKLDLTYLPPPESKFNIDSSSAVEDYLEPGPMQLNLPESTDGSSLIYTSPPFFVSDLGSGTTYDDHMPSEKTEEFKTESPTNQLEELSTPFFYNRFQVPEELLINQNNEMSQGILNEKVEDSEKQNYTIKSNKIDAHVLDKNELKLSNLNLNQNINLSLPRTDLQPHVQMVHSKSKTDANILFNDVVMDGNNILSTTESAEVYSSPLSNSATLFSSQFAMKATSLQFLPNNSVNTSRPKTAVEGNAYILNNKNAFKSNTLAYSYDTSNGIHADVNGTAAGGVRVQGSYSYTGDDGKLYTVVYTADENGFQPRGDHLPTPPPIPEAILKVIELAARDEEQGIFDDGSYNVNKYGDDKYDYDYRRHRPSTENIVVVNGVDLLPENNLNYCCGDKVNLHRSSGENELTMLRDCNVSSEDSKQYVLNGEFNKGMRTNQEELEPSTWSTHGLRTNSSSQPVIINSLFKILSVIDNNEVNQNNGASVDLINKAKTSNHDDNIMNKTSPHISEITERKGYYYDRPQKDFETPTSEEALANIEYGSSANGGINISVSNNSKIEVFVTPNVIRDSKNIQEVERDNLKELEQINHKSDNKKLLEIKEKNYDSTFSLNKGYETYYPNILAQQVPEKDVYREMAKNFLPATTNNLLRNLHTINTAKTENYDGLPNSTPFGDIISLNVETTESFTTIGTDASTEKTLSLDKQNDNLSDTYKNLISKTSSSEYYGEEKHIEGYPQLNSKSSVDESEHKTSEYNSPASTIFIDSPTKPTLPYYKNYVRKSPFVKIIGEDFTGPKQLTKYDSNSGYYY